jgi:DNA repair protein RecN (Recombination protein N)
MRRSKASAPAGLRLLRLEIEDFGLIERAALEFAEGLTICSGETGSGKTMLLGALAFVLGDRVSSDVVRGGAARARVTLEVEVDAPLRERMNAEGFELETGEPAIFSRELAANGKSSARLNGRPATAAQVREFGEALVDRVGQHEQQRLLSHAYQRDLLDRFGGPQALARRAATGAAFARVEALATEVAGLSEREGRALAEFEFAQFGAREIDALAPQPGEDEQLRERRDYLANAERIASALAQAQAALSGESAALESLGAASGALQSVSRFAAELGSLSERLAAAQSEAADVSLALARELDRAEFDPAELEALGSRLDALERLKRKYGGSLEAVAAARAAFGATIEAYANRDERRAQLAGELEAARATLAAEASALSALRAEACRRLESRVAAELAGLAMPAARFAAKLEALPEIGPGGAERVEFELAPNPGEPLRALSKAASGGELSRVLLALVVVFAERRDNSTLVFDEIDAGVGGATANAVGVRLGTLSRGAQVVCVTHLAQIASWADRHYALRKREVRGKTTIDVVELHEQPAMLEEIARMLSGSSAAVALEHARTLLAEVRERKAEPKLSA